VKLQMNKFTESGTLTLHSVSGQSESEGEVSRVIFSQVDRYPQLFTLA